LFRQDAPPPIIGKVSQETLAAIVGSTRSRISFFMNKFRRLGFIESDGRLSIPRGSQGCCATIDPRSDSAHFERAGRSPFCDDPAINGLSTTGRTRE